MYRSTQNLCFQEFLRCSEEQKYNITWQKITMFTFFVIVVEMFLHLGDFFWPDSAEYQQIFVIKKKKKNIDS